MALATMTKEDEPRAVVQQADAADEPHGGWKDSEVAYRHLKSGSQLIRGVRPGYSVGCVRGRSV